MLARLILVVCAAAELVGFHVVLGVDCGVVVGGNVLGARVYSIKNILAYRI